MRKMMAAIVLLVAPTISACSGGDDQGPDIEPRGTPVDGVLLETAVGSYSDAFLTGDSETAYDLLSARCQERLSSVEFAEVVRLAAAEYGGALEFRRYAEKVEGSMARVSYFYDVKVLDQTDEPWVLEDGKWRQDDC